MSFDLHLVDAFAAGPFSGNPAAVVFLDEPRPDDWCQDVAAEMNQSETAFVEPRESGSFPLRWFTPVAEVDLCGHATLASAHALWSSGRLAEREPARFQTRSGPLHATRAGNWIELDFPADPPTPNLDPQAAEQMEAVLGARCAVVATGREDCLVEMESEQAVRSVSPDLRAMAETPFRGIIVTAAASHDGQDFVSRFFAPRLGVDEDPVTGSAHCTLGPYWAKKLGREELVGCQVSKRGGIVRVKIREDRVILGGQVAPIMQGKLEA